MSRFPRHASGFPTAFRLIHAAGRRDVHHQIATSAIDGDRQSAADDFSERRQIGRHSESLRAPP
jgi:hypothetical protein